ncbi:MAG: preprotein translocase subunit SecG [Deltaproteobacteria bacterium]|jgi:preprotein translocase subunit SecG|nr:preprotein translocase subunit SecG [Deltaproteobacteria bacterium]
MSSFITTIHVIVAVILMISVLLQTGKGSGLGAAFGGSSGSVFGARGPATLIARITTVAAIIFMVTSLTLSVFAQTSTKRGSVVVADPVPETTAPVEGRSVSEDAVQTPVVENASQPLDESSVTTEVAPVASSDSEASAPAGGEADKSSEEEQPQAQGVSSTETTVSDSGSTGETVADQSQSHNDHSETATDNPVATDSPEDPAE